MKVVINKCFGGFGLSEAAVRRYAEIKGIRLWIESNKDHSFLEPTYWTKPPEERPQPLPEPWISNSLEDRHAFNEASSAAAIYERDIPRDDPALVQSVEELGDRANGRFAELAVVKIPDGIEWEISDYDGQEHIDETHRSWR